MTPLEFHTNYYGWGKDVDGVAGIQCVDLFKEFLRMNPFLHSVGRFQIRVAYSCGFLE